MKGDRDLKLSDIKEWLDYDAENGYLTWKIDKGNMRAGARAGCFHPGSGYRRICISYVRLPEHRLIWFYVHGEWPQIIDHINGIKSDNRLSNLRNANPSINSQNRRFPQSRSSSGYLGVTWNKSSKLWQASITVDWKLKYLGLFQTKESASAAYINAKREYHIGCTL